MHDDRYHYLIINNGDPFKNGERIRLKAKDTLIGRSCETNTPDIVFDGLFISRNHALVCWNGQGYLIQDLQSKHGTQINGLEIEPNQPYEISDGDQISLAKGMVNMVYKVISDFDDRTITLTSIFLKDSDAISINLDRREVHVEGVLLNFSGKERDLLMLLYRNRSKAVSYDEIKADLWPERKLDNNIIPDVGNDEINALVYRLRKRLGKHGQRIITVARYGVLLDI